MGRLAVITSIVAALLPIVGVLIILWSDVQVIKISKIDYREVAELKVNMIGTLSKNTEAIENLNKLIDSLLKRKE